MAVLLESFWYSSKVIYYIILYLIYFCELQ
jgi:hypothetical protein